MSTHIRKVSMMIMILTSFPAAALAEQWKNIVPGVSTRSDVVRLLQNCEDRTLPCEFQLEGDIIRIVFSSMVQDYFYQCAKNLPPDTVLLVEVTPRLPIRFKRLRQSYRLKKLATMSKLSGYFDESAGLVLKTDKDHVIQFNYVAAVSDRLRCEDYYSDPMKFVLVVTHCPPITIEGPTATVTTGDIVNFKANVQPDPKMTLVWTVSGGKIVAQAGREISLDTTGLSGKSVKVTAQALGSCSVENSLTLNIRP